MLFLGKLAFYLALALGLYCGSQTPKVAPANSGNPGGCDISQPLCGQ